MKSKIIYVKGMHCSACKLLLEKSLIEIKNVSNVDANVKKGTVEIQYKDKEPDFKEIEKMIKENGYEIGKSENQGKRISTNKNDYIVFFVSLIGFLLLYFIIKKIGRFDSDVITGDSLSLGLVVLIGLIAGFSSCMAIVGGLVLAVSSKRNSQNENERFSNKIIPHLRFNLGRIIGFGFLGGILGLLGGIIKLSPIFMSIMTLLVGIILILLGFNLSKISPKFGNLISLPTGKLFKNGNKIKTKNRIIFAFCSGILTFFLPCGFTFSMQVYALSTGSFWMGALVMMMFAIGTIPGLLGIGTLSSVFRGKVARVFYQIIGVLVILLGIYNISNAWGNSMSLFQSNNISSEIGMETINMTYTDNGLLPKSINLGLGKNYQILIDMQTTVYGCMSTITLPGLDNSIQDVVKGNVAHFQFTTEKSGAYDFKCAMGLPHNAQIIVK